MAPGRFASAARASRARKRSTGPHTCDARDVAGDVIAMTRRDAAAQTSTMTKIFADKPWYRDRREPERDWEGILSTRAAGSGPNTREALGHLLEMRDRNVPVYTPSLRATLHRFINRRVRIVGEPIDLSREGFGEEIWPGWIELR